MQTIRRWRGGPGSLWRCGMVRSFQADWRTSTITGRYSAILAPGNEPWGTASSSWAALLAISTLPLLSSVMMAARTRLDQCLQLAFDFLAAVDVFLQLAQILNRSSPARATSLANIPGADEAEKTS